MNQDPYSVLGLSPNATEEEVKAAYKRLAKKYHPDVNQGSKEAEDRMKEINAAYQQIMRHKSDPNGAYGGGARSYSAYQADHTSPQMRAAINYINTGYYREALNVLEGIHVHDAQWYYVSAVANASLGNVLLAVNHAQQAVNLEPNNFEYRRLLNELNGGAAAYRARGGNYSQPLADTGKICLSLIVMRLLCGFCGYPCC